MWLIFSFMGKHVERNKSTLLAPSWGRVHAHSQKCRLRATNSPSVSNTNESFSLLLLWIRHRRINQFQAGNGDIRVWLHIFHIGAFPGVFACLLDCVMDLLESRNRLGMWVWVVSDGPPHLLLSAAGAALVSAYSHLRSSHNRIYPDGRSWYQNKTHFLQRTVCEWQQLPWKQSLALKGIKLPTVVQERKIFSELWHTLAPLGQYIEPQLAKPLCNPNFQNTFKMFEFWVDFWVFKRNCVCFEKKNILNSQAKVKVILI